MSDFRRPEYQPYITLCQEINLKHDLTRSDCFYEHTPPGVVSVNGVSHVMYWSKDMEFLKEDLGQYWFWMPTLSDWLSLVEERGYKRVQFDFWNGGEPGVGGRQDAKWIASFGGVGTSKAYGLTREEAVARLYLMIPKISGGRLWIEAQK